MNKRIFLSFLIFLSLITMFWHTGISHAQANLLFKSGFESGVAITGSDVWEKIRGTDSSTGYTWETDIPGRPDKNVFNYLICSKSKVSDYATTRIENVTGPYGNQTQAFYQNVIRKDPCSHAAARSQYNIYADRDADNPTDRLEQIYTRYWTKLEPNLPDVLKWRLIMEWLNNDYRWGIYIYAGQNGGDPYWHVQGELLPEKTKPWQTNNFDVAVPIDEWFLLEVFWKQSAGPDGQLWVAVNGEVIADIHGSNKREKVTGAWCIFKNYGSVGSGQWIDDVEIWDNIPNMRKPEPTPIYQKPKPNPQTLESPASFRVLANN